MKTQDGQSPDLTSLFSQWMDQANQYWESAFKMRPGGEAEKQSPADRDTEKKSRRTGGASDREKGAGNRFDWQSVMDGIKAMTDAVSHPGTHQSIFSGLQSSPLIIGQLAGTAGSVFTDMQQQWAQLLGKSSEYSQVKDFTNLDKEAIERWTEIYDKEFRKFITMPQLGLSRFHQERANQVIDRFNDLQLATTEFFHYLYRPIEQSAAKIQAVVTKWTAEGNLPDNPKAYYREWIRILEGEYMILFKSPEYSASLGKVMVAAQSYDIARKDLMEQALKYFAMPTNRDLDGIYKTLHDLKKRVSRIEKQLQKMETKENT